MQIDCQAACQLLAEQDNIVILCHAKPDGDTLGSAFALLYALEAQGKTARVESPDGFPRRYEYLYGEYCPPEFQPGFVVAVDVAGFKLLGGLQEAYADKVDLCIDHHRSNDDYAKHTLLDPDAAAAAQVVWGVIKGLGIKPDKRIANAVFTGISTDTGCFQYSSVTAETHRIAAEMICSGAEHARINKLMHQTRSRGRVAVDQFLAQCLEYYFDGRCAVVMLPADLQERFSAEEEELEGIPSFPITIEGVLVGVTIRDKGDGTFRVSARSEGALDAARICQSFGGGGHHNAAGCTMRGTPEETLQRVLAAVQTELELCAL